MALTAGSRIGPYEIVAPLGAGGMGEVYRARDTRLNRDVAIKVLPDAVAVDPDRLARLGREAQALAALNHPNIAAIYGIEEIEYAGSKDPALHLDGPPALRADGAPRHRPRPTSALVMELVAGEDLSARIRRGPIPLDEALPLARQIADALAAAHEAGIVHRDLKPANIKVRDDGTVKVLDFGLAKAFAPDGANAPSGEMDSPTISAHATKQGVILGTVAYMAPEQARGKPVDRRADIWAFGVVCYEMLAGRRPFAADSASDVLAQILTKDPDWDALPAAISPLVRRLLRRCLRKDPKQRLHDIADARLEIEDIIAAPGSDPAGGASARVTRRQMVASGLVAALSVLAGLALGAALWRKPPAPAEVVQSEFDIRPSADDLMSGGRYPGGVRTSLAWSPDGRILAFVGSQGGVRRVLVRSLRGDLRALAGTEGVETLAFSPDGLWLAFFAHGSIQKIPVAGGTAAPICRTAVANGISWGQSRIVYADARQLFEVPVAGGDPKPITDLPTQSRLFGLRHASPFLLPGDVAVLYTEHHKSFSSGDERVMVKRLPDGPTKQLLSGAADARYLPTGHLAYLRQGKLYVATFDLERLEVAAEDVAMVGDVSQAVTDWTANNVTLNGQFAVSSTGTLAYLKSPPPSYPDAELVAIDRRGQAVRLAPPVLGYRRIALWPDESTIAAPVQTAVDIKLFLFDVKRGSSRRIAESVTGEIEGVVRAPDGRLAAWIGDSEGSHLAIIAPEAASLPTSVPDSGQFIANDWSPDGRHLVGWRNDDLLLYSPGEASAPWAPLFPIPAPVREWGPSWSPDGRWLAYVSDISGKPEIYVRPFPGPGKEVTVSLNGGNEPVWNPDASKAELFFTQTLPGRERQMMAVSMADPTRPGTPSVLFDYPVLSYPLCVPLSCYAFGKTSQRFYTFRRIAVSTAPFTRIALVQNWFEDVKAKAPSGR